LIDLCKIPTVLVVILLLQFAAVESTLKLKRYDPLGADASERAAHNLAGVAVETDQPANDRQLQRADMPRVLRPFGPAGVERVRLTDADPRRLSPVDPVVPAHTVRLNRYRVLTRRPELDEVIRDRAAALRSVRLQAG